MRKFKLNEVYYSLTFVDIELCYPTVTSFVFMGKNLCKEDEDVSYFLFLDQTMTYKTFSHIPNEERRYRCLTESELAEMLDTDELNESLKAIDKKRNIKDTP